MSTYKLLDLIDKSCKSDLIVIRDLLQKHRPDLYETWKDMLQLLIKAKS